MLLLGGVLISSNWMLMGVKPVYNSGIEREEFIAYATDSFQELLDTSPIVDTVILYNYDLSESKELGCIIQNNTPDTLARTMERQILCPIGTLKAGMYIYYHNNYWLVTGRPDNNKIYEKVIISLCQYKLSWQYSTGKIIERWAYGEDLTKYSTGITGNNVLSIGDNKYGITLPIDSETSQLKRGTRFVIDLDTAEIPDVYKLTNRTLSANNNLYADYGGLLNLTLSYDVFDKDKDKLINNIDGNPVWICNYHSKSDDIDLPPSENAIICNIDGRNYVNIRKSRKYTLTFTDLDGISVSGVNYSFNINSDSFDCSKVLVSQDEMTLNVLVDEDSLIGESFLLSIFVDSVKVEELEISIKGLFG